jgi:hypothetical protein
MHPVWGGPYVKLNQPGLVAGLDYATYELLVDANLNAVQFAKLVHLFLTIPRSLFVLP